MKKVWKYTLLQGTGPQFLDIPVGSLLLTVQLQLDQPRLWAVVEPDAPKETVTILVAGTGHEIKEGMTLEYLGTFQYEKEVEAYHAFHVVE